MTKSRKVQAAIIYSGSRHFGGIDTYLLSLFSNYPNSEIELTLVSLGDWELTRRLKDRGFQTMVFPKRRFSVDTVLKIRDYLRKNNFDLVVTGGNVSNAYGRAASWFTNLPVVTTVHSDPYFDYPNPLLRAIYSLVDHLTRFRTKKYIVVSKYLKVLLENIGIDKSQISLVNNGVAKSDNNIKVKPPQLGDLVIGSVGRLHYVKGYHNLIEAAALLRNEHIIFKIVGSGDEKAGLLELAKRLGVAGKIQFLGYQESVEDFIAGVDIYIQPSLAEGFGLSVVQAMLLERPIIVTPVGGLPEIISDGKTGYVANDTDAASLAAAISRAIVNVSERGKLAKQAKIEAEKKYGIKEWAKKTIEVFLEVAGNAE